MWGCQYCWGRQRSWVSSTHRHDPATGGSAVTFRRRSTAERSVTALERYTATGWPTPTVIPFRGDTRAVSLLAGAAVENDEETTLGLPLRSTTVAVIWWVVPGTSPAPVAEVHLEPLGSSWPTSGAASPGPVPTITDVSRPDATDTTTGLSKATSARPFDGSKVTAGGGIVVASRGRSPPDAWSDRPPPPLQAATPTSAATTKTHVPARRPMLRTVTGWPKNGTYGGAGRCGRPPRFGRLITFALPTPRTGGPG